MSAKIMSYQGYVAGWLDSTIHEFLSVLSPSVTGIKYALITCLDSNFRPADLRAKSPELKSIARRAQVVGSGLLLPAELLLNVDSNSQIFFGFDEVWFFPSKSIEPKPASASLVGPARLDRKRLKKLAEWMSANSCSLGLGGGEGLNFIVKAHGLVRYLLAHSIRQPESSLATS